MAYRAARRKLIIGAIVAVVVLFVCLLIWSIVRPFDAPETTAPNSAMSEPQQDTPNDSSDAAVDTEPTVNEAETPTIDPATLSVVAVEPLGISVSYIKGVPPFSFSVNQTDVGTQYAEFSSDQLIGTKCTDDDGTFVSIVKNPTSQEDQTTLSLIKKIGSDTYGLSLPSATCTPDTSLFTQYQAAFKDAFGLLQAL